MIAAKARAGRALGDADRFVLLERAAGAGRPFKRIFSGDFLRTSMLLGGASFVTQLVIVYIITWMPTLLVASGIVLADVILVSATISLGGITGSLLLARIIDRVQSWWPLTAAFVLAGLAHRRGGTCASHRVMLFAAVAQAGGLIVGAQVNLGAYCATVYPTDIRFTGLGWVIGLGRADAICGALMGTAFVAAGLTLPSQYGVSGVATLVIALLPHATCRSSDSFALATAPAKSPAE